MNEDFGPGVMPIDGKMIAEVTFGKHKSTDEFIWWPSLKTSVEKTYS